MSDPQSETIERKPQEGEPADGEKEVQPIAEQTDRFLSKIRKVEQRLPGFEHRLRGVFEDLVATAEVDDVDEDDLLLYEKLHGIWVG